MNQPTTEQMRVDLKALVRGAYDIQKLRIQEGNRISINFKSKLGLKPSEKEEELEEFAKDILKKLRKSYTKIMDGVKTFPRQKNFKGHGVISTYTEMCLMNSYIELEKAEKAHFAKLQNVLYEFPIYIHFLEEVRGVGPAMAGVIISEFDIHKAEYPSSFWKYAGLDVAEDGKGRSKRKEHLVDYEYTDKDQKPAVRKGITFNPFLKAKLIGVLATSFLRSGTIKKANKDDPTVYKEGTYGKVYADYKNRIENMKEHEEKSKGHRHNMALRYAVKIFLIDLHMSWREMEGLAVSTSYCEGKLGKKHKAA